MKKSVYSLFIAFIVLIAGFIYFNFFTETSKIKKISFKEYVNNKEKGYIIDENNSTFIHLNNRKNNFPFHPIRLCFLDNKIFYIDTNNLYAIDLKIKKYIPVLIKKSLKTNELVSLTKDVQHKKIYLLDKLDTVYSYSLINNLFELEARISPNKRDIEPEYKDLSFAKTLCIIDSAQNKIINLNQNKKVFLPIKNINITESISIYKENNIEYILDRGNILKVIRNNSYREYNIAQKSDRYSHLNLFSDINLKNIYFSGGYNGNIISVDKVNKRITGNYYILYKNKPLPVYNLDISDNKLFILAGNYLIIKNNFEENKFSNISINHDNDLLENSIKDSKLKNFLIPIENYSGLLPTYSSVYPGARRLYRYGIHEGIDFFGDKEGNIEVNTLTPVVASKSGNIIRIDKKYDEMSVTEHNSILRQCLDNYYTSSENIDKLRGRQVWIKHDGNIVTVYAHLSKVNKELEVGSEINENDLIGYVGNTGTTDGVYHTNKGIHLHFEIHVDDKSKKLEYYLGKYLSIEETMQIYRKILD